MALADVAATSVSTATESVKRRATTRQDWKEAIEVSQFYGRSAELTTLGQWILRDRSRLVVILGMGEIGKTALAAKLAEQIQNEFEYLIWFSLRNSPPIDDVLAKSIRFLSNQQETELPARLDEKIARLMNYLRASRCLLVFDTTEQILQSGEHDSDRSASFGSQCYAFASPTGSYQPGYEGYGQLLRCIGLSLHQSCLVVTSREKPIAIASKEGKTLPVRSLQLTGLPPIEARKILLEQDLSFSFDDKWEVVIKNYGGNPLVLKMVAFFIQNLFNGNIAKFLEVFNQRPLIFDELRFLLERQFNRLPHLEKEIMYKLAINQELVSFLELQEYFVPKVTIGELVEALASLNTRGLIEQSSIGFTQHPMVMDYINQRLTKRVIKEMITAID